MATLAPTVHERLARCGTRVFVDGLVLGADVVLSVGGTEFSHTATGASHTFTVPSLVSGAAVKAKQDAGTGYSPWSPVVVVEDAAVPPTSAPGLPDSVGACSHCVRVDGLVPGCRVELLLGSAVVGEGTANRHGAQCVGVDFSNAKRRRGASLRARMYVCGVVGPESTTGLVAEPALPKPVVGSPLYGCQRVVPLSNLHRGARVRLETDTGTDLGSICSCWTSVNVRVGSQLVTDEQVHAQLYWQGDPCADEGPWSEWQPVIAPDEGIKPVVLAPLIAGDQIIRVDNQILGASLMIKIRPSESQPPEEFGPRPASEESEIALNAPLAAGNVVSVVQTLCTFSVESDPVTVLAPPPVVLAPVIIPPLYDCGTAVQVSNVHPGALVRVYLDGIPIGLRWAGLATSISVSVAPFLAAGGNVTARQWVGSVPGPESAPPVAVLALPQLQTPRILRPVALKDTEVWVSRVIPGGRVTIQSGGPTIGEADAAEPIVRVPVSPVTGPVRAKVRLCQATKLGGEVTPVTSPCAAGTHAAAGEEFRPYANWMVPATADGDAFETHIEGQLYFPATAGGKRFDQDATNLPLVIIAHGYWNPGVESYKGYDYLAKHLARWGMLVFSLNMDDVNNKSSSSKAYQYARGEIVLHAIDVLLADSTWGRRINRDRIGLIGHSMGGEGVVAAQALNESEGRGYSIRGVVSIAPTHWRPEIILRQTRYMQLLGSMDVLTQAMTGDDSAAIYSGFRIYDRAWRPKTHFWIYRARHNPFNRVWVADGDKQETDWADTALPPHVHERLAKCLINAFFQDALRNQTAYAGYMHGTIFPRSLYGLEIHTQHSRDPREVLDNFGDLDEQVPLAAAALDKTDNSRGQAVSATGAGLGIWGDIEHVSLANSPHNTKGAQVGWTAPDVLYQSDTGGLSAGLTDVFALRIGQFYEDAALNPEDQPADLFVTLSDGADEATVRLGAVAQVPYPDSAGNVLCPMRTVRLPIDAFKAASPSLNLTNIQSVTLWLAGRATGNILVDDLEFSS